ncbi:MAG: CHAT domain-containing protein [bacterium]|nr:CHAT domain-containing protein [bacterium]
MGFRSLPLFPLLLAGVLLDCAPPATDPRAAPTPLSPDGLIERELTAADEHVYEAHLTAGRPWLVTVEQRGIDVVLEASGPGDRDQTVNSPTYRRGPETLLLQPAVDGTWCIEVRARLQGVGPGDYEIRLDELTRVGPEHQKRLEAESAASEAARLNQVDTAAARRQAIEKYSYALQEWRDLGADRRWAWTLLSLAILHRGTGDTQEAVALYQEASSLFGQVGELHGEADALNDLGLTFSDLGLHEEARLYLQRALDLHRQIADPFGEATALNNLCLDEHRRDQLRPAQECYEETLELLRNAGEIGREAVVLSNLGNVYDKLGEPEAAIETYRQAISIRRSIGDLTGEARTRNNLGVLLRRLGEAQDAIAQYSAALEIFRREQDQRWEGRVLGNLGVAYYSLNEWDRARAFLEEALTLRRAAGDRRGEAATLNNLGRVQGRLGDLDAAAETHRQALAIARQGGYPQIESETLDLLGQTILDSGQPTLALDHFSRALEISKEIGDRREQAAALHRSGVANLRGGDAELALVSLSEALELRRAIQDRQGEAESLAAIAQAEARLGRFAAAREHVRVALEVIESLRTDIADPDLRAAFSSSQRRAYELEIDLLMRLHAAEPNLGHDLEALAASERARARTLVDLLHEAGARLEQGVDPELRRRARALRQRLNAKVLRRVEQLSRGIDETDARLEQFETLTELETVEAEIRRQSPAYAELTRPSRLAGAEIQALLGPGTMLLEYSLGEERSFLWALTEETVTSFELPGRQTIEAASLEAYRALSVLDLGPKVKDRDLVPLSNLSRLILVPVADLLARRVVVVADGALHYIPFGALPLPPVSGERAAGPPPFLLQEHEIVNLPSASALAVQREEIAGRPAAPRLIALLADPVFDPRDPRVAQRPAAGGGAARGNGSTPEAFDLGLDRLPASRDEAIAIAELLPSGEAFLALDFDASRELAESGQLRQFRIIHFATHGLIDSRRSELSGLMLSMVDREGNAHDGILRLRDLYSLELGSDLVVLSGCRTALGREVRGEGLVGLTRGFMYAGAPRVVASLWQVEDRATGELMERFYRAMLVDGLPAAAALRRAQLSIAAENRWSDPFFWAGFVFQGDWR